MGREVLGDAIEKPALNGLKRANTVRWVKPEIRVRFGISRLRVRFGVRR
jgi:hypothetical protein